MAIDIMFGIMVLIGGFIGFTRGIIKTVLSVLSIVFGFMAGFKFAGPMTTFLKQSTGQDKPLMFLAGFFLSFAIVMILIRMFAKGLESILQSANINIINQIMGGFITAAVMVLLYSYILWFLEQSHLIDDATKRQSMTYAYVKEFPGQAQNVFIEIKPIIKDFWDQSIDMMDQLEEMGVEKTSNEKVYDIPED